MNKETIKAQLVDHKVFVVVYETNELVEITNENVDDFDRVDLDEVDSSNMTKESIVEYYSQPFEFNRSVVDEAEIQSHEVLVRDVLDLMSKVNVIETYHVDCEADVFIVQ